LKTLASLLATPPPSPPPAPPIDRKSPTKGLLADAARILENFPGNDETPSSTTFTTTAADLIDLLPKLSIVTDPAFDTRITNVQAHMAAAYDKHTSSSGTDIKALLRELYDTVYFVEAGLFTHSRQNSWHEFEKLQSKSTSFVGDETREIAKREEELEEDSLNI
jgi:hypothetical protein